MCYPLIRSVPLNRNTGPALLGTAGLSVLYRDYAGRPVTVLDDVTIEVRPGEILGITGESGSGKSTLALALCGLLPRSARRTGSVLWRGRPLAAAPASPGVHLTAADAALIWQEPALVLHPCLRAVDQVAEAVRAGRPASSWRDCLASARDALAAAGLDPVRIAPAYPHQLSGGELRRVMFAQAIACRPSLLVADEPTASLDQDSQGPLLEAIAAWGRGKGAAVIVISHSPTVLERLATRAAVLYAGRIVETGPAPALLDRPLHPYTQGLLACARILPRALQPRLTEIPGDPPDPRRSPPPGCAFAPRCPSRFEPCTQSAPPPAAPALDTEVRCYLHAC